MNIFTRYTRMIRGIGILLLLSTLSACLGGGGGTVSTLVQGTAAAGAPIVGFVSVRDASTNPQPVLTNIAIAADGKYTVDVKGLTPPFAFLADGNVGGKRVQLYSVATQADVGGTINITPFTDLIVRNMAGTVANTLVDSFMASGKLANLTAAQIDAERVKLTAQLAPVMTAAGLATGIDLVRAAFNADGTGLDRFMDLVKVDTTVPTAVTITNILDANAANKLTVNSQTGVATGASTTLGVGLVTASGTPTPLDLIRQTFASFAGFFATALPNSTDVGLTALFAQSFKDDGQNSNAFLTQITTSKQLIGLKFGANSLVLDSIDPVAGIAQVSFVPMSAAGVPLAQDMTGRALHWQMKKDVTGKWLLDGNQRIAHVRVRAAIGQLVCTFVTGNPACGTKVTGLELVVDNKAMLPVGSAVITGAGLPAGGVTLTAAPNNTWLQLPCVNNCWNSNLYEMTDATINTLLANGRYTVQIFDNAVTPALLASYTEVVPVVPKLNTALATTAYPSISNMVNLTNYAGGTLTPSYSIPTGLFGDAANVYLYLNGSNLNQQVQNDIQGKATSGTLNFVLTAPTAGGTWSGGNYWIQAWDGNGGGKVYVNYQ
jgi:hypothetical protein